MSSIDLTPERTGPFTGERLAPDERGPQLLTEENIRQYSESHPVDGVAEEILLAHAERALRLLNKSYNNRTIILKNAIAEFYKVIGLKPTQAKNDVWLPCGRIISHGEFITNLQSLIKEYQPCLATGR